MEKLHMTREEIEKELERVKKQLYLAENEDDAKGGTEMGKILIESYKKKIKSLEDKLINK